MAYRPSNREVAEAARQPIARMVAAGVAAVVAMLVTGWMFNQIEEAIPSIGAEYLGPPFRTWPGWTETYMAVHPIWFGFLFAAGFLFFSRLQQPAGRLAAAKLGASYGAFVFLVGSLPAFALVYASFRVSAQLLAVSWVFRNMAQYLVAGVCVGLVMFGRTQSNRDASRTLHSPNGR